MLHIMLQRNLLISTKENFRRAGISCAKKHWQDKKQLGVVPQNTVLAPKPTDIKDWDKLTADEKRLFEKQMEVFAGFAEHTDEQVGRLVDALKQEENLITQFSFM